jgi:hypothetical protein
MNRCFALLCTTALLAGQVAGPCQASEVGDYLTQDGKLKEAVTITTGAAGLVPVGGPKTEIWTIEPSGEWTSKFTGSKGKLSAKQLAALAQHLATQDFNSLPKNQGYEERGPDDGYLYVKIAFGKKQAAFNIGTGKSRADYLPKPGDPKGSAWSRFIALELVLGDMLGISELKQKKEK